MRLTVLVFGLLVFALVIVQLPGPAGGPGFTKPTWEGMASWYGHPFHGRTTANMEIYDMNKLTAAHRYFPINTWVRVTHLGNGKQVTVRINDRGPYYGGRIIDLSRRAAGEINMIQAGTAKVRLEIL